MSGTYKFNEFKAYLKLMFGNNNAWEEPIDYYGIWVNVAYKRLTTRNRFWGIKKNFYFPELEVTSSALSTVDGTAYVTTPTDALIVREVWDSTSDVRLNNIPHSKYIEYTGRSNTSSEGEPKEWVRQGTKIFLYPTPDAIYSLYAYYRKIPSALSSTSTTVIGGEWDEVILQMAYIIGKEWLGEYDKLGAMKKDLAENLGGIIGVYDSEELARRQIDSGKPESTFLQDYGYK